MLGTLGVSGKHASWVYTDNPLSYPPTHRVFLIHSSLPLGLSTVPRTHEAFSHLFGWFTHTRFFHILFFFSFPMHSPSCFLPPSEDISNAVPVPYIQSWRLPFPASVQTFAKPGKMASGQPLSQHDTHPRSAPQLCTVKATWGLAHPLDNVEMWKCNLHVLWQETQGRIWKGGRIDRWPWDSDFLSYECADGVWPGDKGQGLQSLQFL